MKVQGHGRLTIFQAAAVDDERLGNAAFRVLAALGTYSDKQGWCYPTQTTLAKRLRITRQAVSKSLLQLAELGYIAIHHQYAGNGAQTGSRYRLCLDMGAESCEEAAQYDVAPPQPRVAPMQRDVAPPATSEVAPPRNVATPPPATSEVAHNVPELTTQQERPRVNDTEVQFARFWAVYPKRKKKQECLAWFKRLRPDAALVDTMIAAVERSVMGEGWQKEGGRYIPLPDTWLNGRRWEDEDEVILPVAVNAPRLELVGRDKDRVASTERLLARRGYARS